MLRGQILLQIVASEKLGLLINIFVQLLPYTLVNFHSIFLAICYERFVIVRDKSSLEQSVHESLTRHVPLAYVYGLV